MTWRTVKLGDVCSIKTGRKDVNESNINGQYPFFTCAKEHTYSDVYSFDCEAILIAGNGAVGQTAYYNGKFEAYQRTYVLSEFNDIMPKLLLLILQGQLMKYLSSMVLGNTIPYIKKNMLENFEFSIPPFVEQQHTLAKLDTAFAEIDKNIDFIKNKEQEINILNEIILSDEFKLSPENKKLNEVCKIFNGGTPDTKNKTYWNGNAQWLTPRDMGKLKNENVIVTLRQLTEAGLKNSSASLIPKNSIILSCRAPIGHLAINNVPMAFNQGCKGLVPDSTILQYKYLYYFLFSSKKLLNNLGTGTTFKEISSKVLSSVKINVPSLDRQKKIINKLDLIFKELQKLKDINKKQIENYSNLKKALLKKELISKAA